MIKIVTSREMREMDRYAIEEIGIPGPVLMENAGKGTFQVITQLWEDCQNWMVYVFCGKGNNGGDGYVIARYLHDAGAAVRVFIVGSEKDIRGDAKINFDIVRKLDMDIRFLEKKADLRKYLKTSPDLVVDALLGTGITGAVNGLMKDVIDFLNQLDCLVLSVDIPSGLNADSPVTEGAVVAADITVTMALPKRCHMFYPSREKVGKLYITDIGIPAAMLNTPVVPLQAVEKPDIVLPNLPADTHKYQRGKVGVLAGSTGYTGAAVLTSQAALAIGAGLVILGTPMDLNPVLEMKLTEVITKPYGKDRLVSADDPAVIELLDWCDVLAIGPGLGRSRETQAAVSTILKNFRKPVVVDADALFALASKAGNLGKTHPNWVLTPHHGEFIRLLKNFTREEFRSQFVDLACQFAIDHQLVLLLKGAPSLVAAPDGQVYVNTTGNPGLASGGTGDVLTGFVAGLMVQGLDPVQAAISANYLHGLCADEVATRKSGFSLTAGDLVAEIGATLQKHFFAVSGSDQD